MSEATGGSLIAGPVPGVPRRAAERQAGLLLPRPPPTGRSDRLSAAPPQALRRHDAFKAFSTAVDYVSLRVLIEMISSLLFCASKVGNGIFLIKIITVRR